MASHFLTQDKTQIHGGVQLAESLGTIPKFGEEPQQIQGQKTSRGKGTGTSRGNSNPNLEKKSILSNISEELVRRAIVGMVVGLYPPTYIMKQWIKRECGEPNLEVSITQKTTMTSSSLKWKTWL